ncbi:MAG: hypothetical protein WC175_05945 [Candidatus Dojkabacteria bacterium]
MKKKNSLEQILTAHNYLDKSISVYRCGRIFEYDIQNAGFTILKNTDILPVSDITYIETLSKKDRNIYIGRKSKEYPEIFPVILNKLTEIRKEFALQNSLVADDILSIKKDAFFLFKQCNNLSVFDDLYHFTERNVFSSYLYVDEKEFYYDVAQDRLVVKNLSHQNLHSEILGFIKKLIRLREKTEDKKKIFDLLKKFKIEYLSGRLDVEYYRELNNIGKFKIELPDTASYYIDWADTSLKPFISHQYNYANVILPIITILL